MQQIGPPISYVFKRWTADSQVASSASTLLMSQAEGIALSLMMLTRSYVKWRVKRVSSVIAQAPCLIPVRAKAIPTILSILNRTFPWRQYSTVTCILDTSSHIQKSIFLPCMTTPSEFLTSILEQALKVENSYMKLRKNNLSKGSPLSLAIASTSLTKSWWMNSFLAYHQMPSQKPLGMGRMSKNQIILVRTGWQSRIIAAQRSQGGSSSFTRQTRGMWDQIGPTWGTTVAKAIASKRVLITNYFIGLLIIGIKVIEKDNEKLRLQRCVITVLVD